MCTIRVKVAVIPGCVTELVVEEGTQVYKIVNQARRVGETDWKNIYIGGFRVDLQMSIHEEGTVIVVPHRIHQDP